MDPNSVYGHSRSRTTSSNVFPGHHHQGQASMQYNHPPSLSQQQQQQQQQHHSQYAQQQYHPQQQQQQHPQQYQQQYHQQQQHHSQPYPQQQQQQQQQQPSSNPKLWRRSPSINTFSTSSSFQPPPAYRTSSTTDLRRSTSSRSVGTTNQATSYVALLRKQKATVWCERAQYEDPHLLAQQRAAKMRANLEVVGGYGPASRTKTGISATGKVAAKIRHHGKTPVVGFAPGETHVGVGGVPRRLLEDEEQESDEDDDTKYPQRPQHNRAGSSGRSSTGSGQRSLPQRGSGNVATVTKQSSSSTPERTSSLPKETLPASTNDVASGRASSSGSSGSAAERQDALGELGTAPGAATNSKLHAALTREKSVKTAEELKRRGSVDERTATLTSGRLFIANPD